MLSYLLLNSLLCCGGKDIWADNSVWDARYRAELAWWWALHAQRWKRCSDPFPLRMLWTERRFDIFNVIWKHMDILLWNITSLRVLCHSALRQLELEAGCNYKHHLSLFLVCTEHSHPSSCAFRPIRTAVPLPYLHSIGTLRGSRQTETLAARLLVYKLVLLFLGCENIN